MKVTRAVAGAALAAAALLTLNAQPAPAATDGDTLRGLARQAGLRFGTAVDMAALAADTPYRETIAREFNSVTAENVMKWESIEAQRGVLDFTAADQLVDFARANGQQVRGHTLLWHNQNPSWLTDGVASGEIDAAELRQILRRHVIEVAGHFRGRIYAWDVVNEVIDDNGQLRDSFWLQQLGPGYIADVFRWARQADPKAKLYLNDYNVEGVNAKSTAYYELAKQLRRDGVPVHGFGVQGHLGVQYGFPGQVLENLRRFERLGLETAFTEVDVRMPMPPDDTKLQAQAYAYSSLLTACLLAQRCVSFTVWGYTDKYSWVPGFFTGQGAANLLDEAFQPKPAYDAVSQTLRLGGR
ncbi:endo-1,4-beta-xylanase [Actinomycetes bacterium KLBMP 9797]